MNQPALTTSARTILRVIAGFLFAAHGWQKFNEFTIAGTQAAFTQMGVPAAQAVAPVVATLELVGGVALILGVLTRVFAVLLALDMLGALFLVHASAGVFVATGGYELVLILAAAALAVALVGAGRVLRGPRPVRPRRLEAARPGLRHPRPSSRPGARDGGRSPFGGRPPSCVSRVMAWLWRAGQPLCRRPAAPAGPISKLTA